MISMHGLSTAFKGFFEPADKEEPKRLPAISSVLLFALLAGGLFGTGRAAAQRQDNPYLGSQEREQIKQEPAPPAGKFRDVFSLNDAGSPPIELHGIDSEAHGLFTLPETHVPKTAKLHVFYIFSPSLVVADQPHPHIAEWNDFRSH